MMLSEAIDAVSRMIRGYANGGQNAGKAYIGAIAELLCRYPRSVSAGCADPFMGVVTTTKFLPTPADICGWCEPRVEEMAGKVKREEQIEKQFRERKKFEATTKPYPDPIPPGCMANLFVPSSHPLYSQIVARAMSEEARWSYRQPDRDGIWIPISWLTDASTVKTTDRWKRFTVGDLQAVYDRNTHTEEAGT